jgi:hypothetical protein
LGWGTSALDKTFGEAGKSPERLNTVAIRPAGIGEVSLPSSRLIELSRNTLRGSRLSNKIKAERVSLVPQIVEDLLLISLLIVVHTRVSVLFGARPHPVE